MTTPAALGVACSEDGGVICDGRGQCIAASCRDGVKDGDETDVDCGGSCAPCDVGGECIFPADCASNTCDAGVCQPCPNDAACAILGGYFCGALGSCEPQHALGDPCLTPGTCTSGFCADGVCCDSLCNGPCQGCGGGSCAVKAAGATAVACDPYLCDGQSVGCPSSCTGDGDCVAGGFCDVTSNTCQGAQKALGQACDFANECQTGFCVDGVCCAAAGCAGGCNRCNVPSLEGQCAPAQVGTLCRAATDSCDVAELCDGIATACPSDAVASAGTVCRASLGGCDPVEICDGAGKACPADLKSPSGTVCRAVAGACDLEEQCDGVSGQCPFDAFLAPGTICHPSLGECDPEEICSGFSASCPVDVVEPAGTPCGGALAEPVCDPDSCDGAGLCLDAPLLGDGTPCTGDGIFCSGLETCQAGQCTSAGDPCATPLACAESLAACVHLWVNELHYDNDSTDVDEGVEIAGAAGTNLSGFSVVLYNGNGGTPYGTIPLGGVLPNQQAGLGTAFFGQPGLQNGSPDGLALVSPSGAVVEFLSYEGSFTATAGPAQGLTSQDIGVSEATGTPVGASLQRIGTGSTAADFTWSGPAPHSRGGINVAQVFQ